MAEKILNTRILMKVDTLERWNSSTLPLKKGELAFATVAASAGTGLEEPVVMVKIGTAEEKTFSELPWAFHAKASDVLTACKSEAGLKAFVNGVIADAGIATNDAMEALAGKVTTAEGKITTLEGKMTAVEGKAAANESAIAALDDLVGDKKVATQISEAIAALDLANTYELKGEAAKVQTALDTYKTANDKAVADNKAAIEAEAAAARAAEKANADAITAIKDGTTIDSFADVESALAGKEASGAAAQALTDAKAYADGLAGNYDAKGAAATAESNAKAYAKEYADGLAGNYDAAGSASAAEAAAKKHTDDELARLVGTETVASQIGTAIANQDLANKYDAKGAAAAAESAAKSHADGLNTAMNTRVEALEAIDHEHANAAELAKIADGDVAKWNAAEQNAKDYADSKDEAIEAAQAAADKAQEEVDALETYVGTFTHDTAKSVVEYINAKTDGIATSGNLEALGARVTTIEGDLNTAETGLKAKVAVLEGLVGDKKVSEAIDAAVLVETNRAKGEEARIEGLVSAEAERAAGVEAGLDERLVEVETFFKTAEGETIDQALDTLVEIQKYLDGEGEVADQMLLDIAANKKAIEDHGKIDHDFAAADSALKSELEGKIALKAAQADLEALDDRVETAEGEIDALQAELDTAETGLKARMTAAEADIDALETKVGDETVAAQIEAAIEALKIGDYAKAADLTAAVNRVTAAEGKITTLEGKMTTAEGDIDALETEVAKKANDADLAAIAKSGNVNDLVQTEGDVLIFDCGNSEA